MTKAQRQERKARSIQSSYRKATDKTASLSIKQARQIIAKPPLCPYCDKKIPWQQLSIDHKIPKSRGGLCEPSNLVWSHLHCNVLKGGLLPEEFDLLRKFMETNHSMKDYLTKRLKAGGAFIFGNKRRFAMRAKHSFGSK